MPRRFARLALALLTAATLVAAVVLTVLAMGRADWAVNLILGKINPWPSTSLRAADVTGNLLTAPTLYRLSLTRADGEVMLRADSASVRYDLRRLLAGDITLADVRVYGPDLVLRQRDDGRWDLPPKRTRSPGSPETTRPDSLGSGPDRGREPTSPSLRSPATLGCWPPTRSTPRRTGCGSIRRSRSAGRAPSPGSPGDLTRERVTVQARGLLRPGAVTVQRLTLAPTPARSPRRASCPSPDGMGVGPTCGSAGWTSPPGRSRCATLAAWCRRSIAPAARASRPMPRAGIRDRHPARRGAVRWEPGGPRRGGDAVRTKAPALPRTRHRAGRRSGISGLTPSRGDRITGEVVLDLHGPEARPARRRGARRARRLALRPHCPGPGAGARELLRGQARVDLSARSERMQVKVGGDLRPLDSLPVYRLTARLIPGAKAPGWARRLLAAGRRPSSARMAGVSARAGPTPCSSPASPRRVHGTDSSTRARYGSGCETAWPRPTAGSAYRAAS